MIGKHALIVHDFERPVNVVGYDQAQGTLAVNMKTVSGALAYDDPQTGEVIIIMVHQAVLIPHLEVNLLCPMQVRVNDVKVEEIPKFLAENPTAHNHAIYFPQEGITVPLALHGAKSYFPTRKPTMEEYNKSTQDDGVQCELTYETPDWDPLDNTYNNQEENMMDSQGNVLKRAGLNKEGRRFMISSLSTEIKEPSLQEVEDDLGQVLQSNRVISGVGVSTTEPRRKLDPATLAAKWDIGLEKAQRTIEKTTQRGMRMVLHPSLSRRFRTNDRQMHYRRLPVELYTDTLEAGTLSRRQNRYAQVFGHRNGWVRAMPMKNKSDAHEALSQLFVNDGVP